MTTYDFSIKSVLGIFGTRTAGPWPPCSRIRRLSAFVFVFCVLYFTTPIFFPIQQFFNFTTIFTTTVYHRVYHKFYHKLLPQTTIMIGVSISSTTPNFVLIKKINFTTHFTTNFSTNHYHYCHPPPTMFSVPKRNTGKCFERT